MMQIDDLNAAADQAIASRLSIYLLWSSIGCAIAAFVISVAIEQRKKNINDLATHTGRAAAALTVPSGIALIYCGVRPAMLQYIPGLNLVLVVAALAFVFVAIKASAR